MADAAFIFTTNIASIAEEVDEGLNAISARLRAGVKGGQTDNAFEQLQRDLSQIVQQTAESTTTMVNDYRRLATEAKEAGEALKTAGAPGGQTFSAAGLKETESALKRINDLAIQTKKQGILTDQDLQPLVAKARQALLATQQDVISRGQQSLREQSVGLGTTSPRYIGQPVQESQLSSRGTAADASLQGRMDRVNQQVDKQDALEVERTRLIEQRNQTERQDNTGATRAAAQSETNRRELLAAQRRQIDQVKADVGSGKARVMASSPDHAIYDDTSRIVNQYSGEQVTKLGTINKMLAREADTQREQGNVDEQRLLASKLKLQLDNQTARYIDKSTRVVASQSDPGQLFQFTRGANGQDLAHSIDASSEQYRLNASRQAVALEKEIAAKERLISSINKEAETSAAAGKSPLEAFLGSLTSKGYGNEGSLAGIAGTAGITAKYAATGAALFTLASAAHQAVTDYADLDRATREFNSVVGDNTATDNFVNNLQTIASVAGVSTTQALDIATRGVAAFQDQLGNGATRNDRQALGESFANTVIRNSIITNQTPEAATDDIVAAGRAYGLTAGELDRVNNALAVARHEFGANSAQISEALQLMAESGKTAGYSLEQFTQVIGLIQGRTGESGQAIAGNLQRIFALFSGSSGRNLLTSLHVDTTGTVKDEIEGLAAVYPSLTDAQKSQTSAALGGSRALRDLLPLLEDNKTLQEAFTRSLTDGGAADREVNAEIKSLGGVLKALNEILQNLAVNVLRTGIATPFALALQAALPLLRAANSLLNTFNRIPAPLRDGLSTLLEIYGVMRLVAAANLNPTKNEFYGRINSASQRVAGRSVAATDGGAASASAVELRTAETRGKILLASAEEVRLAELRVVQANLQYALTLSSLGADSEAALAAQSRLNLAELHLTEAVEARTAAEGRAAIAADTTAATEETAGRVAPLRSTAGFFQNSYTSRRDAILRGQSANIPAEGRIFVGGATEGSLRVAQAGEEAAQLSRFSRGATALRAGAGAAADGVGRLGAGIAGMIGPIGLAIAGTLGFVAAIGAIQEKAKQGEAALDADKTAQTLALTATSVSELQAAAQAASAAAADHQKAGSGLLGGLVNTSLKVLGVQTDSDLAAEDKQRAKALAAQADALNKRITQAATSSAPGLEVFGNRASDFTFTTEQLSDGLTALSNAGVDATTKMRLLTEALNGPEGLGGPGTVGKGQAAALGASISGQSYTDLINTFLPLYQKDVGKTLPDMLSGFIPDVPGGGAVNSILNHVPILGDKQSQKDVQDAAEQYAKTLFGKDPDKTRKAISDYVTQYITASGLNSTGGVLSDAQLTAMATHIASYSDLTGKQKAKYIQSIKDSIKRLTDDSAKPLSDSDIALLVQQTPTIAQGAQQHTQLTTGNSVAAARAAVESFQDSINVFSRHHQTIPQEIIDGQTAAYNAYYDALTQQAADGTALKNARLKGEDSVQEALNNLNQAKTALEDAQFTGDQSKITQALTAEVQARNAYTQAVRDRDIALIENINPRTNQVIDLRDVLTRDQRKLEADAKTLAGTTKYGADGKLTKNYIDALEAQAQDRQQYRSDQLDIANSERSAAVYPGSQLQQARVAVQNARATLAGDLKNSAQYWKDYGQLQQAKYQLAEAERVAGDNAYKLTIDLTDPVATARDALRVARQKLSDDRRAGADGSTLNADTVDVRQAQTAAESAAFSQRIGDLQTAEQLGRISHAQYLAYLQAEHDRLQQQIAGMKTTSNGYRQAVDELNQVDQAMQSAASALNGQFNIGNIDLPTPYEVRRAIQSGSGFTGVSDYSNSNNSVTINGADFALVVAYIQKYLGIGATKVTSTKVRK